MANPEHLAILKKGFVAWNQWRMQNPKETPDLNGADLSGADLRGADLRGTVIAGANLSSANLSNANLIAVNASQANLIGASLPFASLGGADLNRADLRGADLRGVDVSGADLGGANLRDADLRGALLLSTNLRRARLQLADLSNAKMRHAMIVNVDLSEAKGLEYVDHIGPSSIGIDTLYESQGKIPDKFLRDAGVPEEIINLLPSIRSGPAIQWYSCFISYSTKDEEFARRLHGRMRQAGLRVWFAPEDLKGGDKLYDQIDYAIQLHDKLLLILSENSIKSEWVMTEIRRARAVEKKENRRKLFPIRLVDFDTLRDWTCFDADTGKDLAVEVREYFIPDFSDWKNHDAFEAAFDRLLKDLRAEDSKKA
jgi:hypothetical protein